MGACFRVGLLIKIVDLEPDPERRRMDDWMARRRADQARGVIQGVCQPYGPGHRLHR